VRRDDGDTARGGLAGVQGLRAVMPIEIQPPGARTQVTSISVSTMGSRKLGSPLASQLPDEHMSAYMKAQAFAREYASRASAHMQGDSLCNWTAFTSRTIEMF
jgi:hypothetical protein